MKITDEEYQLEILKNLHRKLKISPMFEGYFTLEIPEKAEADLNSFSYNIRYLEEKGFIETDSRRSYAKITATGIKAAII